MNASLGTKYQTAKMQYDDLVRKVKNHYRTARESFSFKGKTVRLTWPDFIPAGEMNLWTYWQGQCAFDSNGSSRVKIMLVGKDFGAIEADSNVVIDACRQDAGELLPWNLIETKGESVTDKRLCYLFRQIDARYDILNEKYPELFFTNFIPAYRDKGLSGGDMTQCFENARGFFAELVNVLGPQVILCLGQAVYENAMLSLGGTPRMGLYNPVIEGGHDTVRLPNDHEIAVFPLAHCGIMGTNNRNRSKVGRGTDLLDLQVQDWRNVKRYLDAHEETAAGFSSSQPHQRKGFDGKQIW